MKKRRRWPLIMVGVIGLMAIAFLLGPKPGRPDFSSLSMHRYTTDLHALEDSLKKSEATYPLKPDNEARIVWATPYQKTPYCMVYLHGNGASQEEGDPIHEALANRYGYNLYLARLEDHGLQGDDPLLSIDPVKWMQSALDAIEIGKALGEKVIVVSCSTGSTLALYLAARYPDLVEAQIMLSPNVDYYDPRSFMMAWPWGLQLTRFILGSAYYGWKAPGLAQQYWYTHYRIEGIITLKAIIDETMNRENFHKINDPLFMAYYYMDDDHQDHVVSVQRMREMFAQVSTPLELKKAVALQDAGTHIIGSDLFNEHLASVWTPLVSYCEEVLHLVPVKDEDWKPFLDIRVTH